MSVWQFVLTDLQGKVLGEVTNASARKVTIPLKATPTASFTVQTGSPLAPYLTDPNWDGLVKGYRDGALRFCGPVVSGQEQGSDQGSTVQVNAAGPFWRMNYRLLGVTPTNGGVITPWTLGTSLSTIDLGLIAWNIVNEANAHGYTGIEVDSYQPTSSGAAGPYQLQPAGDAIINLAAGTNSFEFMVNPVEPTDVGKGWPKIGSMQIGPLTGTVQNNVIFEYGAGARNVLNYSNTVDRQGLLTRGFMLQPAATDFSDTLLFDDATAQAARGMYEGAVDSGSVEWDVYRQMILQENVIVRRQARQVLNFTPHPAAAWQPYSHYFVGDQVRARVTQNGVFRFDAMFRIWGIEFDIDDAGNETPTLQLVPPTPGS